MKRKDLLLLTFLLSQTAPTWAMEEDKIGSQFIAARPTNSEENEDFVSQVQWLQQYLLKVIKITKQNAEEYKNLEQVIVIGPSGSGKSTLINLLAGKDLVADKGKLDTIDPISGSEIGHDYDSTTTLPSPWKGPDDRVYWDSPGFEDSRGPEQDIVNTAIREVFSGKVKILLTVPERFFGDRGRNFLALIDNVTKIFSVSELKQNLALVITKQGKDEDVVAHEELKKLLQRPPASDNALFTRDVKNLLEHLENKKEMLVPYFPAPLKGVCNLENPREAIFRTIACLSCVENPTVHSFIPPESTILISDLAQSLNKEVRNSLDMLRHKVVQLCKHQTNAYTSDGTMQGLEINLRAIHKSLALLVNASTALDFTHPLDPFFDQGNIVKEYVKTLMFLKTLKNNIDYSNGAWARTLQLTLDDMHELIDSLANKLCQKITTSLEAINESIRCKALPEPNNEERSIEEFSNILKAINTVVATLQENHPDNMIHFAAPLSGFTVQSNPNSIESHMGTLGFLKTLKQIDYPIGMWTGSFNLSITHLQQIIRSQENSIALKEQNRRLEEEHLRAEAAARRAEEDRQARLEESARRDAEFAAYQTQIRTAAAEAAERKVEEDRRAAEAAQQLAAAQQAAVAAQQAATAAQQAAQHLAQQLVAQQAAAAEVERQRQAAVAATAETERQYQAAVAQTPAGQRAARLAARMAKKANRKYR